MTVRERLTTGTLVVRERRVVYASAGAAAILEREARELMGRVFFDFLVPEARERISDRYARRLRREPVPSEYEMELLLPGGGRRTVEAHVSLEGQDEVVIQLRDLSDQAERRGRLLGLAELGVAIQRERTEAAIHERVREGLFDLGLAALLLRPEPGGVRVRWVRVPSAVRVVLEARLGAPAAGYLGRLTPFLRTALEEGVAFADDFIDQAAAFLPPAQRDAARALTAAEALVRGLAVRLEERSGAGGCLVVAGEWIGPGDVPALRLFAAQVAAALDSARAIAELSSRNFDLAALNRLGELAGGAVGLDELLPQAGEVLRATTGCDGLAIFAAEPAAGRLRLVHQAGAAPELIAAIGVVGLDGPLGAMLRQRQPQVTQLDELSGRYREALGRAGFQTFASVPLAIRSRVFGIMTLAWRERRDAPACRPDLLLAMGAHFAAAMEADHLLGDLRRRVDELTLLNDVAVDIAALDPAHLLERALRRMCATFGADGALAFLQETHGLERQAAIGLGAETLALTARLDPGEGPAGLAMARLRPVLAVTEEEAGPRCWEARRLEGFQALVAVPLLAKSRAVGALCLGRRAERPFSPGDVALLSALGAQLGVAVDLARQHADTQRRARDLEAISSLALRFFAGAPGDVPRLLEDACAEVLQALRARQTMVLLLDEETQLLTVAAEDGGAVPAAVRTVPLERSELAREALRSGAPTSTEDSARDPRSARFQAPGAPGLAWLAIPITSRTRRRGVLLVGDAAGRRFAPADLALATALGGELAMALEAAELHAEAARRLAELSLLQADLQHAQARLLRQERLAALGELSAVVAHEVRNPLGVIFNSLGSLRRLLRPVGDAATLIDIMGEEADRLNRIVGDLLDFARPTPPQVRPERLERLVEEAVAAALALQPTTVEVVRELALDLPAVPLDGRQVRQALLNVAVNAVQAMPRGGRLTVRARAEATAAVVELEDTGPGIPDDVLGRIFEPFFTTRATGSGLGLAVVKRILDDHGGEIEVRSRPGQGTRFTLRFPLRPAGAVELAGRMGE